MLHLLAPPPPVGFSPMGGGLMSLFVLLGLLVVALFIAIIGARWEDRLFARRRYVAAIARGDMEEAEHQLGHIFAVRGVRARRLRGLRHDRGRPRGPGAAPSGG